MMKVQAFVGKMIIDTLLFFNVGKMMTDVQVGATANLIIEEFYYLKPDDFKLCFTRAKKGVYGKVYDRLDGQVIFEWLNTYAKERMSSAEESSILEAEKFKNDPHQRTSSILQSANHEIRKYDFERKFKGI